MIRPTLCFVAESVAIDRDTNEVAAFGFFEELNAAGFPIIVRKLFFFALLERDASDPATVDAQFTVTLGNEQLLSQPLKLDFRNDRRMRASVRVMGTVLQRPGRLDFRLTDRDTVLAQYSINVTSTAT